jgi:subtilisin
MKKHRSIGVLRIAVVLVLLLPGLSAGRSESVAGLIALEPYVPSELLVKFKPGVAPAVGPQSVSLGTAALDSLGRHYGVSAAEPLFPTAAGSSVGLERIYKLKLSPSASVLEAAEKLAMDPNVEYAEPNFILTTNAMPHPQEFRPAELAQGPDITELLVRAQSNGVVRVIVGLRSGLPRLTDALATPQAEASYRIALQQTQSQILSSMSTYRVTNVVRFQYLSAIAMTVDAAGLRFLASLPMVVSIEEDQISAPTLTESVALVGGKAAWNQGYTGAGWTVAIVDTGVAKGHQFLTNKVVSEACYSSDTGTYTETINNRVVSATISSACATSSATNPITSTTQAGSAEPCPQNIHGCDHGTHVAGIVAGKAYDNMPGGPFSGIAPDAELIAIQVFSRYDGPEICNKYTKSASPCALTSASYYMRALERVIELRATHNIAAVNMSLGGGEHTNAAQCDQDNSERPEPDRPSLKDLIESLREQGIATVVSAGNEGYTNALGSPACISSAISVGSTNDGSWSIWDSLTWDNRKKDTVSTFSNSANFLTLLAPGSLINSSAPDGGFQGMQGTSMAAPHVAGAWALLKQKAPLASVTQITQALVNTGVPITDTRAGANSRKKPRIQVDRALNTVQGALAITPGPVYNFGIRATGSTSDTLITIKNTGSFPAVSITSSALTAPFSFVGGTYPGTRGNCGTSLNTNATCTIHVSFSPSRNIAYQGKLQLGFTSTTNVRPLMSTLMLQGTGGAAARTPTDPYFPQQSNLHNTGQNGGTADADIDAPEAWGITTGSPNVTVAVIDSGVYYTHGDLNDGRVLTNNDWDYANNDSDALDDNGHGTHVAGIIAAETNNSVGIAGIMWRAKILPLKVCDNGGSCKTDHIARAIHYASDQGARVINLSLGSSCSSQTMADAINYAYFDKKVVVVAAAGNSGGTLDYPGAHDPVLAVGATDNRDLRARFSSTGERLDLVAPGVNIRSTVPKNSYDTMSGTSMATPHVAGVAGLLIAQRPELTPDQVRDILRRSADDRGASGFDKLYGYGRLNAFRALQTATPSNAVAASRARNDKSCSCAATSVATQANDGASLLTNLRALRDQVFTQDPGKRWARIYYEHQFEVAWMVVRDSEMRSDVLAGWREFDPVFQSLLHPDQPGVKLTPELIATAKRVMMGVADRGSPAVHDVIVQEWQRVDPDRFAGWNVHAVWEQLRRENQMQHQIYLPIAASDANR